MSNADHYSYRVFWSPEDAEFVGACSEFPSLSHLASSPAEALEGIRALVSVVVADIRREGSEVPEPLAARTYSGHLHVRLPSNLHRGLALEAGETGRSINRVLIDRLVGHSPVPAPPKRPASGARIPALARGAPAKKAAKKAAKLRSRTA